MDAKFDTPASVGSESITDVYSVVCIDGAEFCIPKHNLTLHLNLKLRSKPKYTYEQENE